MVISSVLDVHDDTPMPKGAPPSSHFSRSILILTPQRALKFTATSLERHHVWMNALSFLSQGAVDFADIIDQPPPVPTSVITENSRYSSAAGHRPGQPSMDGSLHRSRINDSIRIAKGKERPSPIGRASTNHVQSEATQSCLTPAIPNGAEAPTVPRTTADTRTRSKNSLRGPAYSVKSQTSSSKTSMQSLRSRPGESHQPEPPPRLPIRLWPGIPSRVVSENSMYRDGIHHQQGYPDERNLFEAVGTIRMSAFVHDTSDSYISNQRTPNVKKIQPSGRSISYDNMDIPHARDVPQMRYHGRVLSARKYDQGRKLQNGGVASERSESAMTNRSVASAGQDPFEGF